MRHAAKPALGLLAAALVTLSCSDRGPTGATAVGAFATAACTANWTNLRGAAANVFGPSSATAAAVAQSLDAINAAIDADDAATAEARARELVAFVHAHADEAIDIARLDSLVNGILCWVGLNESTYYVQPTDDIQVLKTTDGAAGLELPPNAVNQPAVITITVVEGHAISGDDTKLDRYPQSILVESSEPIAQSTVGVCLKNIPGRVFPRLRMGHVTSAGFRIEPQAPADFLGCTAGSSETASAQGVRGWLQRMAARMLPSPLYARQDEEAFFSGGVGGTAGQYSPFEPVDTELSFSGGVGGTAGQYTPPPAGARAHVVTDGVCSSVSAPASSELEPECRPRVDVKTANGTPLANVPVSWTVSAGGGAIAPEDPVTRACGTFGPSASSVTNANGKAGVCWTMGTNVGANTLVATVTAGGDAPVGVTFSPATQTFEASATPIAPTANAVGASVAYNGNPHPGSGSCSHGLTPVFTYSSGAAPVDVGSHTLTVTCGAGVPNFSTATANATIDIGPAIPVIEIACPASVVYTSQPQAPCTATITAPGLDLNVTPTYSSNVNVGAALATVNYAGNDVYNAASASRAFSITQAPTTTTVTCPASVVYAGSPRTPCTATVAGPGLLLTDTPEYSANNVNAGTVTVTYVHAAGGNYLGSFDGATFTIARRPATATAGSRIVIIGDVWIVPCTIDVLPIDAATITCTTQIPGGSIVPGTYVTVPVVSPANPVNYTVTLVNGVIEVVSGAPVPADTTGR